MEYVEKGMKDYYITHITKFMEDDEAYFLEFDRECDLVFLRSVLQQMGFKVGNVMLKDTIKPQFLPYSYGKQDVYLHFNPVVFRIGLMKESMWDTLPDEETDIQLTLGIIRNSIIETHTVENPLECVVLYQWLHDKRTDLWGYNEASIRSMKLANPSREWFNG